MRHIGEYCSPPQGIKVPAILLKNGNLLDVSDLPTYDKKMHFIVFLAHKSMMTKGLGHLASVLCMDRKWGGPDPI